MLAIHLVISEFTLGVVDGTLTNCGVRSPTGSSSFAVSARDHCMNVEGGIKFVQTIRIYASQDVVNECVVIA